jgi:ERCC4-type nuclease
MSAHIWHTISRTVDLVDRVTISVDVRERRSALPSHLSELGPVVDLVTLDAGDYVAGDRVLECKTVAA